MNRDIKRTVIRIIIVTAILPLIVFNYIFFRQTFNFFTNQDEGNIKSVLERESRYLEYLVEVNIKDMMVISTSDDIGSQRPEEIMEVFTRVMSVRGDFCRMKYVRKDGYTIEVKSGSDGVEYTRTPLGIVEKTCLENGEFAMYSDEYSESGCIVFSAPFKVDGEIIGVVMAYLPVNELQFVASNINLNAVGYIYIKDSMGNFLLKHGRELPGEELDFKYNIKNTDWVFSATIDSSYFNRRIYENLLVKNLIFLGILVILIITFALFMGRYAKNSVDTLLRNLKSSKRLDNRGSIFNKIEEAEEFRRFYNKLIDRVESSIEIENESAYIDKLTGVYNKHYIEDRLVRNIREVEGEAIHFVVFEVVYNHRYKVSSHGLEWDVSIADIGEIIRESLRFRDIAIRFSENKFLLIIRNLDYSKVIKKVSKLSDEVENNMPHAKEPYRRFTINAGIARFDGDVYKTISNSEKALLEIRHLKGCKIRYRES